MKKILYTSTMKNIFFVLPVFYLAACEPQANNEKNTLINSETLIDAEEKVVFEAKEFKPEPIARAQQQVFLNDAGWCWYQDPRAIISNGKLIVGGISGVSGDIRVGVYDLESNTLLGERVLDPGFEIDDHNAPVFHLRNDGRILAIWAMHGRENKHYYSLSNADNYLEWSERQIIEHDFQVPNTWGGVTYMNLYDIAETNTLYNFFRLGVDLNPYFISSADDGNSWTTEQHFIQDEVDGKHRPYVRYDQVNENSIALGFTDAHPRDYGNSIYYATFDGQNFLNVKGDVIREFNKMPLLTSEAQKIYQGSETASKPEGFGSVPNSAWTIDIEHNTSDQPTIAYTLYLSNEDNRYRLANWNGKDWVDREIAYAGPGLYEIEASYTGLIALDPESPSNVVISADVDPKTGIPLGRPHQLYTAHVSDTDSIDTIDWHQITPADNEKNLRPSIISGEGYKVLIWMRGRFDHFQSYSTELVGTILEKPAP